MNALLLLALATPPVLTSLSPAGGQQGKAVTVTLTGTFDRWPVAVWVEGTGVVTKPAEEKGQVLVTVATDATPGPRWLRAYDDQGASVPRRFLVGTLPEVAESEPNDSKPQPLAGDAVVSGRLARGGDVDGYAVRLKKGQTLTASLTAQQWLGSPMDGVLQVASERGFVLAQNNDHAGLDPQITFPVPEDGTYTVRVFAFPAEPDSTIGFAGGERYAYRLTVTAGPFLDHAWPLAEESARSDGELSVRSARGSAGFGFVRLETHPCVVYDKGRKVGLPTTVSGRLAASGERHVHAVEGKKGQRLEAAVESASAGFALDPALRLLDPAGKVLARAAAARLHQDADLAFTLPADGVYRVEVADARGEAGPRHLYRLRLLDGRPDFALNTAADRFTVAPGKAVDVPVTVTPRNGLKGDVTLSAEGLPAGVSAEPIKGGLRLKADAKASSGAFRVVGTAAGATRAVRGTVGEAVPAKKGGRRALPDPGTTVEWLWVTVTGK
ncbi:MAG: pre-peptidase C-terminal domain-containing protein [Gemmataceae bacterium]